jgi:hypothetical protein
VSDSTSLATNNDTLFPDDPSDPSRKLHQQIHDALATYTNNHSTNTDPHGDRAYTDAQIAAAALSGLTTTQVNALIATEGVTSVTANYTILSTDAGKEIVVTATTPVAVTIPTGLPANKMFGVKQGGTGAVSIVAASGVTLGGIPQLAPSHILIGQNARANIKTYTGDVAHVTGELVVSSSTVMPVPTGTPTPGQVPVVTGVSPLALAWGAGGSGGGTTYIGQARGLTSGSAAQSTAISPGGTVIPLSLAARMVGGFDITSHTNAITVPASLAGDYLVVAKAKVSSTSGTVSLANLTNGVTPTGGGVVATGGRARFTVGNAGGYAGADFVSRTFGSISAADVDMTMEFYMSGEVYPNLVARSTTNTLNGGSSYVLAFNSGGTTMTVSKNVSGTLTSLGTYSFSIPNATLCKVRFSVVGTAIKAWIETGTAAFGGTANISITDSSVTAAGYCGFNLGGGGAANSGSYAEIDNVVVTDGAGSPTTLLSDSFNGAAPTLDQKSLSITVNGTIVTTVTDYAAAPRLQNSEVLTLAAGDYVGLKADGPTAFTVEALVANDVSLTLVKQ